MATKKILIVEDDVSLRKALRDKLEHEGYDVLEAHDGQEGMAHAKAGKPDLILMDIMMPRVDGFTALKKLKEDPETKSIPIILLTNLGQDEDIQRGNALGAAGYLIKANWQLTDIVATIHKILQRDA